MPLEFEWDRDKAKENERDHRVSFDEAATAFRDPLSMTISDPDHSEGEERYLLVGISGSGKLLVVSHVERGDSIRLISARPADRGERRDYETGT